MESKLGERAGTQVGCSLCLPRTLILPSDPPQAVREAPPLSPAPWLPPQLPTPLSPDHMAQKSPFRASCRQPGLWFTSAGSGEHGHVLTSVQCSLWPRWGAGKN